ncbi:MAG: MazG nucleotide pyrophosphohydrolase domain-containing protein [Patescibacteria group bacterium]
MFIDDTLRRWIVEMNKKIVTLYPGETPKELVLTRLAKLNEEVGELAGEILSTHGHQRKAKLDKHSKETLESEFADVIISALSLAHAANIDVEKALQEKMVVVSKRFDEA